MAKKNSSKKKCPKEWPKKKKGSKNKGGEKKTCSPALATYELIERIMLHLPLRDLLLSQRISKDWKSVFDRSQGIQQALSVQSHIAGTTLECIFHRRRNSVEYHGRVGEQFTYLHPAHVLPRWNSLMEGDGVLLDRGDTTWTNLCGSAVYIEQARKSDNHSLVRKEIARVRPEASWRKMLLTQPPIREMQFVCAQRRNGQCECEVAHDGESEWIDHMYVNISNGDGIRFEDLLRGLAQTPRFDMVLGSTVPIDHYGEGSLCAWNNGYDPGVWHYGARGVTGYEMLESLRQSTALVEKEPPEPHLEEDCQCYDCHS